MDLSNKTVAVIGASGNQGKMLIKILSEKFPELKINAFDRTFSKSDEELYASENIKCEKLDVLSDNNIVAEKLSDADIIANLAGPFYKLGPAVLKAALSSGINYIDICDDIDGTQIMFTFDKLAQEHNVTAVIGLGAAPGTTNILARLAFEYTGFEPSETQIDIAWTSPVDQVSVAIMDHFSHCLKTTTGTEIDVPEYDDLNPKLAPFPEPLGPVEVIDFGHPEPLTLPKTLGCKTTLKGGMTPNGALKLCWAYAKYTDLQKDRIQSRGSTYHFVKTLQNIYLPNQFSGMMIDVTSNGNGIRLQSVTDQSMEESTVVPMAAGIIYLLTENNLSAGCHAPEAIDPSQFFRFASLFPTAGSLEAVSLKDNVAGERISFSQLFNKYSS